MRFGESDIGVRRFSRPLSQPILRSKNDIMQSEASAGTAPGFDVLGFGRRRGGRSALCRRVPTGRQQGLRAAAAAGVRRLDWHGVGGGGAAGARCAYVGMLGPDELSRFVADRFGREQIDLSHCVWRDDARPVHSTIVVDRNRGTRNVFASFEGAIGANAAQPPAELIGAAEALLVDHHGQQGTSAQCEFAGGTSRRSGRPGT